MNQNLHLQDNKEIEEALEEFEIKSEGRSELKTAKTSSFPKMVGLVMKYSGGAINEQRQAEYALLAFCIVTMSISFTLLLNMGEAPHIPLPPGTKVVYMSYEPPRLVGLTASVFGN